MIENKVCHYRINTLPLALHIFALRELITARSAVFRHERHEQREQAEMQQS